MSEIKNKLDLNKAAKTWRVFVSRRSISFGLAAIYAYLIVQLISSIFVALFIGSIDVGRTNLKPVSGQDSSLSRLKFQVAHADFDRAIKKRNLFNSSGEFPDEPDPQSTLRQEVVKFDESGPCQSSSLNLTLIGTIYLGPSLHSVATIAEAGIQLPDIYRQGDLLFDQEDVKIHKIEPGRVILNNQGKKECLELASPSGLDFSSRVERGSLAAIPPPSSIKILKEDYVMGQLGDGFEKILSQGRLVPHVVDGKMIGFKLIGVEESGIFKEIGLSSGDVITSVNERSMANADQGFSLYEAFQNEPDISIGFLKNGETPSNISVQIRN